MSISEDIIGDPRVSVFGTNEQRDVDIDVARYVALAQMTLAAEHIMGVCEMSLIFCDVDAITRLNEQYMEAEGPTDVLAFPVDDDLVGSGRNPDSGGRGPGTPAEDEDVPQLIGDVFICPKIAKAQAKEHNHSVDQEISLLVVHGTLHLLGHDHYEENERAIMQAREKTILKQFYAKYPKPDSNK